MNGPIKFHPLIAMFKVIFIVTDCIDFYRFDLMGTFIPSLTQLQLHDWFRDWLDNVGDGAVKMYR